MRRDDRAASMGRRALACLLDFVVFTAPLVAGFGAYAWRRPQTGTPGLSPRSARVANGALQVVLVWLRNWRTPGQRLMGVHRVDARTGGEVSRRSAVMLRLVDLTWAQLARPLTRRLSGDFSARLEASEHRLDEIREIHAGDPERIEAESTAIGRERAAGCLRGMAGGFGVSVLVPTLAALRSSRRQTIRDRVSGTVVARR